MRAHFRIRQPAHIALAAVTLALTVVSPLAPAPLALAQTTANVACPDPGPPDYPVAGGWFYTQEGLGCITSLGPFRRRGYMVVDDDQGSFWTEFRRYGGADVLGYPVSQRFHYPATDTGGNWYQGFERGILKWHPETGRAELANVFDMFSEQNLDPDLETLGIPLPQPKADSSFAQDAERRMAWLTEPRFLARYFFDPVAAHSSDPLRAGQASFTSQEQAWDFFGLPQSLPGQPYLVSGSGASRQSMYPLVHTFLAQRFQKGGLELFLQGSPNETFAPVGWTGSPLYLLDPTVVPGDGVKGCVALTAVGLLARTVGLGKIVPAAAVVALPLDPSPLPFVQSFIPPLGPNQLMVQFQLTGSGFAPGETITLRMTDANPDPKSKLLPTITAQTLAANASGAFDQVLVTRVGTYELLATSNTTTNKVYDGILDLTVPTLAVSTTSSTTCRDVGLPVQAGTTSTDAATPGTTGGAASTVSPIPPVVTVPTPQSPGAKG
jgi:LGFP repeat